MSLTPPHGNCPKGIDEIDHPFPANLKWDVNLFMDFGTYEETAFSKGTDSFIQTDIGNVCLPQFHCNFVSTGGIVLLIVSKVNFLFIRIHSYCYFLLTQ